MREERRRIGRAPELASNKVLWQTSLPQTVLPQLRRAVFHFKGEPRKISGCSEIPGTRERGGENKSKQENTKHPQLLSGLSLWGQLVFRRWKQGRRQLHLQTQGSCAAQDQSHPALPARGFLLLVSRIQIACMAGNDNDLDSSGGLRKKPLFCPRCRTEPLRMTWPSLQQGLSVRSPVRPIASPG